MPQRVALSMVIQFRGLRLRKLNCGAAPRPVIIVEGRVGDDVEDGDWDERRRAVLTSVMERAFPGWILRRLLSVDWGTPAERRSWINLEGVRARAMDG